MTSKSPSQADLASSPISSAIASIQSHVQEPGRICNKTTPNQDPEEANKTRHLSYDDPYSGPGPAIDTHEVITALPALSDTRDVRDTSRNLSMKDIVDNPSLNTPIRKRKFSTPLSSKRSSFPHFRRLSASLDTVASRLSFRSKSSARSSPPASAAAKSPTGPQPNATTTSSPPPTTATSTVPIETSILSERELAYLSSIPLTSLDQPLLIDLVTTLQSQLADLKTENQGLKEKVDSVTKDWYRTEEELTMERYRCWCGKEEVERLKRLLAAEGVVDRGESRDSALSGMSTVVGGETVGQTMLRKRAEEQQRRKAGVRRSGVSEWETVMGDTED